MSLPTGLYKIAFTSNYGADYGVIALQEGGKLHGGDSGMAYAGTYQQEGEVLTAQVSITQHRHMPGVVSVLDFNDIVVEMSGLTEDGAARLRGTSSQVPWVRFEARPSLIAD